MSGLGSESDDTLGGWLVPDDSDSDNAEQVSEEVEQIGEEGAKGYLHIENERLSVPYSRQLAKQRKEDAARRFKEDVALAQQGKKRKREPDSHSTMVAPVFMAPIDDEILDPQNSYFLPGHQPNLTPPKKQKTNHPQTTVGTPRSSPPVRPPSVQNQVSRTPPTLPRQLSGQTHNTGVDVKQVSTPRPNLSHRLPLTTRQIVPPPLPPGPTLGPFSVKEKAKPSPTAVPVNLPRPAPLVSTRGPAKPTITFPNNSSIRPISNHSTAFRVNVILEGSSPRILPIDPKLQISELLATINRKWGFAFTTLYLLTFPHDSRSLLDLNDTISSTLNDSDRIVPANT